MNTSRLLSAVVIAAASVVGVGCEDNHYAYTPTPQTRPVSNDRSYYYPTAGAGWMVKQQAFPTGSPATSAVMLSTVTPAEVRVNQPYTYELHVTNLTSNPLQGVMLTSENVKNLTIVSSNPEATTTNNMAGWSVGDLAPNETKVIKVNAKADAVGTAANCLTLSYNNLLCTSVKVTEPALTVTKTAPGEVMICEPVLLTYEVRNTGSGTASSVHVHETLPSGLTTMDGRTDVDLDAGELGPGQAKTQTVQAKAAHTGTYGGSASAMAAGDLTAKSAETSTKITMPALAVTAQGSGRIFLGKDVTFNYTVKNTGDAVSRNTMVNVPVPAGTTPVSMSEMSQNTANGITWNFGDLGPGETRNFSLVLHPSGIQTIDTTATAMGKCAESVAATASTAVQGIPAILLEMVDITDPVQVGDSTTYVITVTNQGSATGTGIKVVAEIPGEEDYVSQEGPTKGNLAGRTLTFDALPQLGAKDKAVWKIVVKANAAKDVRFKVLLTSDQFSEPLEKLESTNLYK